MSVRDRCSECHQRVDCQGSGHLETCERGKRMAIALATLASKAVPVIDRRELHARRLLTKQRKKRK